MAKGIFIIIAELTLAVSIVFLVLLCLRAMGGH